jgi:hypothetical protein
VLRDSALITALIFERPMCTPCIARRTGLSEAAAHTALSIIRRAISVQCADAEVCRMCGITTRVFSVSRPE